MKLLFPIDGLGEDDEGDEDEDDDDDIGLLI